MEIYDTKRNAIHFVVDHDCPSGDAAALKIESKSCELVQMIGIGLILEVAKIIFHLALRGGFKTIFTHYSYQPQSVSWYCVELDSKLCLVSIFESQGFAFEF